MKELQRAQVVASITRPKTANPKVVVAAVSAVLVLGTGAWFAVAFLSPPARTTTANAVPIADAPTPPQGHPAEESLRALQDLRAIVQERAGYPDYSMRTLDARRKVEAYLDTPGTDGDVRAGLKDVTELYTLAGMAWTGAIHAEGGNERAAAEAFTSVARNPALDSCSAARDARDNAAPQGTLPPEIVQGMAVASALPALFACADRRLAEVERRIAQR